MRLLVGAGVQQAPERGHLNAQVAFLDRSAWPRLCHEHVIWYELAPVLYEYVEQGECAAADANPLAILHQHRARRKELEGAETNLLGVVGIP